MARILVVDDEPDLGATLRGILGRSGAEVAIACAPDEALALAVATPFDVAIVDLRLPGRDGVALMGELLEVRPGLRVVIMTAYPSSESLRAALRSGAAAYLEKPYAPEAMRAVVEALLQPGTAPPGEPS